MRLLAIVCVLLLSAVASADSFSTSVTPESTKGRMLPTFAAAEPLTLSITVQPTAGAFLNGQTLDQITAPSKPTVGELSIGTGPDLGVFAETVLHSAMSIVHPR